MAHSIEITSIDNQIPLLRQTKKNEIEERRKVDRIIEIKETNGQDPLESQTKKSVINQIFDEMFEDLNNLSIKSCTIFKVYVGLRESNPDAYTPKMISIGPYYKKNPQLRPMEKYKLLYLQRFLQRKEGLDVESCFNELETLKKETIKCYNDIEDLCDDSQFLQMLLLDGCFVVEFIRETYCERGPEGEARIISDDRASYIFRDLMLLENQLPFFVVNNLHSMTKQVNESSLVILVNDLCTSYFGGMVKRTWASECNNVGNIKHLLHLLHIFSCTEINPKEKSNNFETTYKVMPNATELSEAGVSFAKVNGMTSLFDINFNNGFMKIPCFEVDDDTETILRNLIAYEQQSYDVQPKYFSDYAAFIDHLIDSEKDVNLLRQKGIIVNLTGDDKNVAGLFNKIGNGVTTYPDFYYNEEFRQAIEYSEKPWNRMKANLKHNYFSSPWVGASTVAAIILLILTTIQTILAFTGSVM
ncbi:hypothetical protein R3W88_010904 [Solanum pinnatisectum]|uniref:Uncharacterized protein n=1 Tax=Solanum pinnatisectum TaxID=50273 RepID=A0AAV9L4N5_9SOLN|nr:hypothetical protein R3W88_010904 [Solanum pinnatisectum]